MGEAELARGAWRHKKVQVRVRRGCAPRSSGSASLVVVSPAALGCGFPDATHDTSTGGSSSTSLGGMTPSGGVTSAGTGGGAATAGGTTAGAGETNGGGTSGGATNTGGKTSAGGATDTGGKTSAGGSTTSAAGASAGGTPNMGGAATGGSSNAGGPSYPYIFSCFDDDNIHASDLMIYTSNDALNWTLLYGHRGTRGQPVSCAIPAS